MNCAYTQRYVSKWDEVREYVCANDVPNTTSDSICIESDSASATCWVLIIRLVLCLGVCVCVVAILHDNTSS